MKKSASKQTDNCPLSFESSPEPVLPDFSLLDQKQLKKPAHKATRTKQGLASPSSRKQAQYEEALRELKKQSDEKVKHEFYRKQEEILNSPLGGHVYGRPLSPPVLLPLSPEEEKQQQKQETDIYEKKIRDGLAFFISEVGKGFAGGFSCKDRKLTTACSRVLGSLSLPKTREWRQLTQTAVQAWAFLMNEGDARFPEQVADHVSHMHIAKGNGREYTLLLWLLSLIGMAGAYREDDERTLTLLPLLFHIDCAFFLARPWIIELLAVWHDKGEEGYIHRAFFGTVTAKQQYWKLQDLQKRQEAIGAAVQYLIEEKGFSGRKATEEVEQYLEKFGIKDPVRKKPIRLETVRGDYKKYKQSVSKATTTFLKSR